MVKADPTRDYYGDLGLSSTADVGEIKKQYKKLALAYHPDRNVGKSNIDATKFQRIQSAYEVLIDVTERAKYDVSRRGAGSRSSFAGSYAGSSGTKGNPWSNVGKDYPPPPKPPTARNRAPPPSNGARRYEKFATPPQSAYQAAQEGAYARKATYDAWEHMRTSSAPKPPSRSTTQSREENAAKKPAPPPRATVSDESRDGDLFKNSQNNHANLNRKSGFMPNDPGGDEPPAPRGSYFTHRDKPGAPPVPLREAGSEPVIHSYKGRESIRRFTEEVDPDPTIESRVRTPYSTHGGERFDPFEAPKSNFTRPKTTVSKNQRNFDGQDKDRVIKSGVDPKPHTPHRSRSFVEESMSSRTINLDSSDSEDSAHSDIRHSRNAAPEFISQENTCNHGKPNMYVPSSYDSKHLIGSLNNPHIPTVSDDGCNVFPCNAVNKPSHSSHFKVTSAMKKPIAGETYKNFRFRDTASYPASAVSSFRCATPPSGIAVSSSDLNAFENHQRTVIDALLKSHSQQSQAAARFTTQGKMSYERRNASSQHSKRDGQEIFDDSTRLEPESPSKKIKTAVGGSYRYDHVLSSEKNVAFVASMHQINGGANPADHSFSFDVNEDMFTKTYPHRRASTLSSSTENISTKFTAEDWDGKFAAGFGPNFLGPNPKPTQVPPRRTQSATRARTRSPTKMDATYPKPSSPLEPQVDSLSGTKFSADEWTEIFRPQTFMHPAVPGSVRRTATSRKRMSSSLRSSKGGNATVIEDSSSADDQPLFIGRKSSISTGTNININTPEPMDVDTPPITTSENTIPRFFANHLHSQPGAPKCRIPNPPNETEIDASALKVNFADLKIKDLLSSLEIPAPPSHPMLPQELKPSAQGYRDYEDRISRYMLEWDQFDKKFLLHLVTRKNINEALGEGRWKSSDAEAYRTTVKEDQAVLAKWAEAKGGHERVLKEWLVFREVMGDMREKESLGK